VKISEAIERLSAILTEHGDLPLWCHDGDYGDAYESASIQLEQVPIGDLRGGGAPTQLAAFVKTT
jgi:hypothetical protein